MTPRLRLPSTAQLLLSVSAGLACHPPVAIGQSTVCVTTDPGASAFVGGIRRFYENPGIDSTAWKQGGMPFARGSAITLVTSNSTCASALQAYVQAGGRQGVSQVYVVAVGSTGYVVMAPVAPGAGGSGKYWFDANWSFKIAAD